MSPQWTGQSALPILDGSNVHAQFSAALSLGEPFHRAVVKKDLSEDSGRVSERMRIPPRSVYQKMTKWARNLPLPPFD